MKNYFYVLILLSFSISHLDANNANSTCIPPSGCRFKTFYKLDAQEAIEHVSTVHDKGLRCQIDNARVRFDLDERLLKNQSEVCVQAKFKPWLDLKIDTKRKILANSFNLQSLIDFLNVHFELDNDFESGLIMKLSLLKGINANLSVQIKRNESSPFWNNRIFHLELVSSLFDFYINENRLARSCQDYVDANLTRPRTIFHIYTRFTSHVILLNCIYKRPICPLIFNRAQINELRISGMSNSFFKQNMLSFTRYENSTQFENLVSNVLVILLYKSENIELDTNLLNPFVFKSIRYILIYDSISRIDNSLFSHFRLLVYVHIEAHFFRKLAYKQGIEWMRAINRDVHVNLSNPSDIKLNWNNITFVRLRILMNDLISTILRDEDFCLYAKFPFKQLVAIKYYYETSFNQLLDIYTFDPDFWKDHLSCTGWWLVQYYPLMRDIFNAPDIRNFTPPRSATPRKCNFTKMLYNCIKFTSKSDGLLPKIFMNDIKHFNINSIFILTIISYVLPLFGLTTNFLVIYIIRCKKNADIFKGLKQFDFLCLISTINITILTIQMFSWISDCSMITYVVCLGIRKNVFIQFSRVIIKEVLVVALRFMCNFAYFGFAFNRILLIGRDHPRFVEYIGECKMKKFLLVSGFVSIAFSIVKGFKYRINYGRSEMNYPFNNELDIWAHNSPSLSIYFLFSFISDIFNYVVMLLASLGVDIYMLVCLRKTLNEKQQKAKDLNILTITDIPIAKLLAKNAKSLQNKIDLSISKNNQSFQRKAQKKELNMNDAMNNAIRMVVTNSLLNILLKFPLCIGPLINLAYTFCFKREDGHPNIHKFIVLYEYIARIDFNDAFPYLADFLFLILISIQLFIYIRFDLKMKAGFKRIFKDN